MCHQNLSSSPPLALKFGSLKVLRQTVISRRSSTHNCSRQLKRCVAQLGPTVGIVKPGGGLSTWKRPLLPSWKPSGPGRLVKALGHHSMQPNALPDMQCTMLFKKVYENIDPKSSKVYCLASQFRTESADVVGDKLVKDDAGEMSMSEDSKQKAWLEHYQRLLNIEFDLVKALIIQYVTDYYCLN